MTTAEHSSVHLPRRSRGRQGERQITLYMEQLAEFARRIQQIATSLDFQVSARGWCYLLEESAGLEKGDFDYAQSLITDCRKSGLLPLDICAEDSSREFQNLESIHDYAPHEYAQAVLDQTPDCADNYHPISFWDNQPVYLEMLVEKIDLRSLFADICADHHIPLANARGWSDLHTRAAMKRRFAHWEAEGKRCVLLYCGDHDPVGLNISECLHNNLDEIKAIAWNSDDLIIDRFGLNSDFIEENQLPWIDNLITGSGEDLASPRHGHHAYAYVQDYLAKYGARKCEANALVIRADAGRQLCLEAIERYIDPDAKQQFELETAEARDQVRTLLQRFIAGGADE